MEVRIDRSDCCRIPEVGELFVMSPERSEVYMRIQETDNIVLVIQSKLEDTYLAIQVAGPQVGDPFYLREYQKCHILEQRVPLHLVMS
jgi:hypothetical protein